MDQKTIKLWEEYRSSLKEFREQELEALIKAEKNSIKLFKKWGLPDDDPFGPGPIESLIKAYDKKRVEANDYYAPTFEGFMDWLSNRLTKKK